MLDFRLLTLFVIAYLSGMMHASGAPGDLLFKISAPEHLFAFQQFGSSLAISQGDILVGSPRLSVDGKPNVGQVYLFDGNNGSLLQTFNFPGQAEANISFGGSVAAMDDQLFVLAHLANVTGSFGGAISSFDRSGNELWTMGPPIGQSYTNLLALSGGIVSADPTPNNDGSAGLLNLLDGTSIRHITDPLPELGDGFGAGRHSLASFGDQLVIGDYLTDPNGVVTLVDRATGELTFVLENPEPEFGDASGLSDRFGIALATIDDRILVGAPFNDTQDYRDSGSVFVFDGLTGEVIRTIPNPDPNDRDRFGGAIATSKTGIAISAPFKDIDEFDAAGLVYLYDAESRLVAEIPNPDPVDYSAFGWSVAMLGNKVAVSSPQAVVNGVATGAIYVFEGVPEPGTSSLAIVAIFLLHFSLRREK